jgi:hypothetical protein
MLPHDTKAVQRIIEEKCSVDLNCSEPKDTEAGYIHSVAPDPRRLDIVDNPVCYRLLYESAMVLTHI